MLYTRRALTALLLWAAAATVAVLAIRSNSTNPCAPHPGSDWFMVGVGLFTAAAVFQSLPPTGLDRRALATALLAASLGAAAGFGLWFLLLMIWVTAPT